MSAAPPPDPRRRDTEPPRQDPLHGDPLRIEPPAGSAAPGPLDDGIEALRQAGYAFVDLALDYFKGLEGRRVYGPVSPMGLDDLFAEPLPEQGCTLTELVQECRSKVFPNTMAIGSRRYFGMMNPAPLPVAVMSELLTAAMNQNVASWRHAPAGTAIEKRVIRWLCDCFGLPETSFGTLIDGGSLANITGLKLAINRALGRHLSQLDNDEPPGPEIARLTFYMSDQGHYSFTKAVDLLGLGRGQLRKLPVDDLFRIDLGALETAIAADLAAGLKPCCVIGIAGTTNTGSIDKLAELARIARRHDCWYHVDAAYGGAVILSDRYRPMLQGIEEADSITVDPHKWFYMPFSAGGILVREGDFLRQSFLVHPEYYMQKVQAGADGEAEEFDEFGRRIVPDPRGFHMGDKVNFFQYGVAGSRRFNALKLWMALKLAGRARFGAWIENDIYLARLLAASLRREPDFEVIRAQTPLRAVGELSQPIDSDSPVSTVIVLAEHSLPEEHAAAFAGAVRHLDQHARILAIASDPLQAVPAGFHGVIQPSAGLDAFRAALTRVRSETRKPEAAEPAAIQPPAPTAATDSAGDAQPLEAGTARPRHTELPDDAKLVRAILSGHPIQQACLQQLRHRTNNPDLRFEPTIDSKPGPHAVAVSHRGFTLGYLIDPNQQCPPQQLKIEALWLAHWLALAEQQRQLREAAFTDSLTGAWNRRYFDRYLDTCLRNAVRNRQPVTVLLFDVDNFKRFNDQHGHALGDEILKATVRLLKTCIRPDDRVCRIGGDEFAVVFYEPDGPRETGSNQPTSIFDIARRFQKRVQTEEFRALGCSPGPLEISGGLATFPWDGRTPAELLAAADRLLIESKGAGKNAIRYGSGVLCPDDKPHI